MQSGEPPKSVWVIWPADGSAPVLWTEPCPFPVDDGEIVEYRRDKLIDAHCGRCNARVWLTRDEWVARAGWTPPEQEGDNG